MMIHFFTDPTEVTFTALKHVFHVSSVFCELDLPFLSAPITIRWYGVIIAFGLTLAVLLGGRLAYKWKIDIYKMLDVLIYGCFGGIVGARLYYVACEWGYYSQHLDEIFKIWHGGLAIYGGLIGGLICALIVCIVEKINILNLLDLCSMSFLIGQGIGRWGNFANQEAFGINTDLPWGMYSEKTRAYLQELVLSGTTLKVTPTEPVHPTFLYESIWCLLGAALLYLYYRKFRKFSGQLFLLYGVWYGVERAFVEALRTDSLYIGDTGIRTSQLLSVVIVIVCTILFTIFTIKYTMYPKPIEGVDYVREIPLYRFKRKAREAEKTANDFAQKAADAEKAGNTARAESLRKQEEKYRKLFEENTEKARIDDEAREKKRIAKGKPPKTSPPLLSELEAAKKDADDDMEPDLELPKTDVFETRTHPHPKPEAQPETTSEAPAEAPAETTPAAPAEDAAQADAEAQDEAPAAETKDADSQEADGE